METKRAVHTWIVRAPSDLAEEVAALAIRQNRSVNKQIVSLLQEGVRREIEQRRRRGEGRRVS